MNTLLVQDGTPGNQVTTYVSADGASWSPQTCSYDPNLPSTLYIGLHVSSGNTTPVTATFDNVAFTGGSGGPVTTPPAPKGVIANGSSKAITVRWLGTFGATSYDLLRSTTSGSGYTALASNLSGTSYVDTTAAEKPPFSPCLRKNRPIPSSTKPRSSTTFPRAPA
jgi:hypothetical protein